jgi:spore coat protein U-like protein
MYPNQENAMKRSIVFASLFAVVSASGVMGQTCSFSPAPAGANFGNYSVFAGGGPQTTTPTFNVQCTAANTQIGILLTRGTNSASYTPRTMTRAGGTLLSYNLYLDAANTQIWGDSSGTTGWKFLTTGAANTVFVPAIPIYGSLPTGADVPAGAYTDTITATLYWLQGGNLTWTTANFNVTATVLSECTVSAFAINFGIYEPVVTNQAVPLDSTSIINVFCTKNTAGNVTLDNGSNFSAGNRRMKTGGGAFMTYEVYRDAARTTIWNAVNINTAASTSKLTALGGGFTAYGRIAAGQDIPAGAYTDTLQSVVNY